MVKSRLKKILLVFIAFTLLFSTSASVFATDTEVENTLDDDNTIVVNTVETETTESEAETNSDSVYANTTMEVVENNVCTIEVGDYGEFTKQITEFNAEEKSVTLTLTMTNLKTVDETLSDVEIFFVIDNSSSMVENYIDEDNTITRKQAVIESANSLVSKIYDANPNAKVGVVEFSSLDTSKDEQEGTINDAKLQLALTTSEDDVKNTITNLSESEGGPRTNIDAGLTVAQNNFSTDEGVSRYIILLTDGLPNNTTTGLYSEYSEEVISITKSKLESIENSGISIIGAMIDLDEDATVTIDEDNTTVTYKEIAERIFGTEENSTLTKFFYVPDEEIETIIVNDIFDNLVITTDNTLKNIVIKDYFPQEIIDNFDFEYVASPNIGTVSTEINTDDNSITWYIELLSEGETATLSYKLTLKEDYNQEIIDVILPTNTNVDITGETPDGEIENSSDVSPTIVVKYNEPEVVDNTLVPETKLPQTGEITTWILAAIIVLAAIVGGRMWIINKKLNNK